MRGIGILLLVALHTPAAAEDGCDKFAWPLAREQALLAAADKPSVKAGKTLGAMPKALIAKILAAGALPISRACDTSAPATPVPWACGPSLLPSASKESVIAFANSGCLRSIPESITATVTLAPWAKVCAWGNRSFTLAYCAGSPSVSAAFWSCSR